MMYLGTVVDKRKHNKRPLKVAFSIGTEIETDWIMVDVASWGSLRFDDIINGEQQVTVWDTGYMLSADRYRVTAFWPIGMSLPNNDELPARQKDKIDISGDVNLTGKDVLAVTPTAGTLALVPAVGVISKVPYTLEGKIVKTDTLVKPSPIEEE